MRSIIGGTITTLLMLGLCAALAAYFQSRGEDLVARLLWVYLIASIVMIGAVGGIIFVWVGLARSHRTSIIVGLIAGGLSFATLIITIAWAVKMDVIARQ